MPVTSGFATPEAQLLLTLSTLSYMDSSPLPGESVEDQEARMRRDIDAALAESGYPTWRVVWGPGLSDGRANMLYVAGEVDTNRLAIAIRGTEWEFWLNWIEDFASVLPPVPYTDVLPSIKAGDPQISVGTNIGLQQLLKTSAATLDGQDVDVATFVAQAGPDAQVFVTGHSLGGCLASVLAPSLAYRLGSSDNLKVYTFAGPSAGNQDFADYYDRLFVDAAGKSRSFRLYNDLDIVPASWATLPKIARWYRPAPRCSERIRRLVARVEEVVAGVYAQPGALVRGSARRLRGSVTLPVVQAPTPDRGSLLFFYEVGQQHACATYMELLGVPLVPSVLAKLLAAGATLGTR
jgi:Lipase (class 3)